MKKLLFFAALFLGIAAAAYAQPNPNPNDTVVAPPLQITYFGRGGVVVWPDGRTQYCPEVGQEVCAISNGNYPNDTITIFGGGGVVVYPDGKTLYCPLPGGGVCARFTRQNPTGGTVVIYGSGGTVVFPDGTTHYCPNPGDAVCAITPTRGFVPNADVVIHGTAQTGGNAQGVRVFDTNGKEIELNDARYSLPVAPYAEKKSSTGTGAKID